MSTRSSTLIVAAVSLALARHAAPVHAQDAAAGSGDELETVLVTGIRASLGKSLEAKRESQADVDVLTSEDVGKFPDKNVAEALQRVSGVSISRGFGEGERVSIRGTAPNLNRTVLNGHDLTNAVALTFDAMNLLDEELFQYYDDDKDRPARFYDNGAIYYMGVRLNLGR